MALQVTGNIELNNGITLQSVYCRVNPTIDITGKYLFCSTSFFPSKENYLNNNIPIQLKEQIYPNANYNSETMGSDILTLSNEFVKLQLESKGLSVTIIDI